MNLSGVKEGRWIKYSEEDVELIKNFLKENPNTRVFFQKQMFIKKYGVDNPSKVKEIQDKRNKTIVEKYRIYDCGTIKVVYKK